MGLFSTGDWSAMCGISLSITRRIIAITPCFSNICYQLPACHPPTGVDNARLSLLAAYRE
jgi:hypothetical protein